MAKPAAKNARGAAARKAARPRKPPEIRKSAYQIAEEKRLAEERRELEREQAAAHFLQVLAANRKHARQPPTWPGSSDHAGRLASVGGHDHYVHESPQSSPAGKRIQQPKRGKR